MEIIIPFTVVVLNALLLISITDAVSQNAEKLVLSQLLWRHGDRSPTTLFPTYSHPAAVVWPMGLGALTRRGMQQHFLLGKELRKKFRGYLNETHFSKEISVWSTDFDRTLMSAQMNMAGLYGRVTETEFGNSSVRFSQPVPIHTETTGILLSGKGCPAYELERFNVMKRSDLARSNRVENGSLIDSIQFQSGNVSLKMNRIADAVFCSDQHGISLPSWIASNETIKDYLNYNYENLAPRLFMYSDKLIKLGGGPLLSSLIERMTEKVAGSLTQIVIAYSAHDVTVMALLAALGVFDEKQPFYASMVSLDLYRKSRIESAERAYDLSDYFVVVNYLRGALRPDISKAETLIIPGCASHCPLDAFSRLVADNIPDDLIEECDGPNSKSASNALARDSMILTLSMIIALLVAVLFFASVFFLVRQRRLRGHLPTARFSLMADEAENEATLPLTSHYDDGDLYGYNSG